MREHYLHRELYALVKSDTSIFEFIQSGALDGMWYWDMEQMENEWMSPKFWEILGYDPAEKQHLAAEWQDIINPEDLALAKENITKHLADPQYPYDQVVRYTHKNGSTIWIRCRGLAIRDKNGKPLRMLGAHTDITALKQTEQELMRLADEYEKVFNGTQDAMFLMRVTEDGNFRFIRNNSAHQIKTGITQEAIRDKSPQDLLGKEMGGVVARNYQKCVNAEHSITYEETLVLPEGKRFWLTTLTPIMKEGRVAYIVGSARDLTKRKTLELQLQQYANYDTLTGLPNRRVFYERLEQLVTERAEGGPSIALLYIDLDGFKEINDTYGHEAGDVVLTTVGNRLVKFIGPLDFVARLGGDEFALVLSEVKERTDVDRLAASIHASFQEVMTTKGGTYQVGASIGIALYPESSSGSESLVRNADSAMYEVKRNGKGGVRIFT
ncbi:diguanylate cyclase domain-containing protein [uncultured Sphaerochaeta sp.]|uniref:diguanylate cyclase domain-containing protein n=1 Tax=uncultured Sphaerochaeta sp. TaxID=886478 RepID=UPI002A0A857E|nr:diguanylate cyclase [uncultured Sphaerochaeta sp.]